MRLYEKIDEVLKHYDYVLVGVKGDDFDNQIFVNFPTTTPIMFRYFTIVYGIERVSKTKGMVRINGKDCS